MITMTYIVWAMPLIVHVIDFREVEVGNHPPLAGCLSPSRFYLARKIVGGGGGG